MDVKLYMKLRNLKEYPLVDFELYKKIKSYSFRNRLRLQNDYDSFRLNLKRFKLKTCQKIASPDSHSQKIENEIYKSPKDEFAETRNQIKRVNEMSKRNRFKRSDLSGDNLKKNENENFSNQKSGLNLHTGREILNHNSDSSLKNEEEYHKKIKIKEIYHGYKFLKNDMMELKKNNKNLLRDNKMLKITNVELNNENLKAKSNHLKIEEELNEKIVKLERVILEIQEAIKLDAKNNHEKEKDYEKKIHKLRNTINDNKMSINIFKDNLISLKKITDKIKEELKKNNYDKTSLLEKILEIEYSLKYNLNLFAEKD